MADDIVTRLRQVVPCWCDDEPSRWQVQADRWDAATEIERLREVIEQTWESLLQVKSLLAEERDRVAALQSMLTAYEEQEARRGNA